MCWELEPHTSRSLTVTSHGASVNLLAMSTMVGHVSPPLPRCQPTLLFAFHLLFIFSFHVPASCRYSKGKHLSIPSASGASMILSLAHIWTSAEGFDCVTYHCSHRNLYKTHLHLASPSDASIFCKSFKNRTQTQGCPTFAQ